jgi:hypothetical protein
MIRLRSLQAFEALLVLALLFGIVEEVRNPEWPRLVGIAVNILWQYVTILAIRKQRSVAQLAPAEQVVVLSRQRALLRPLFVCCLSLFFVLFADVGLFVSGKYSIRTLAFIAAISSALTFCFLVFSFSRLRKRHG